MIVGRTLEVELIHEITKLIPMGGGYLPKHLALHVTREEWDALCESFNETGRNVKRMDILGVPVFCDP